MNHAHGNAKQPADKHKGRLICLTDELVAKAKIIGNGNISLGVQLALAKYKLPLTNVAKESTIKT